MQKHDEAPAAVRLRGLEGEPKKLGLPFHEIPGVGLGLFVPAGHLPAGVQIEWALEGEALGADQRIVAVAVVVVLEKVQPAGEARVQGRRLLGVPEHIVVAAQEDFAARQVHDVLQVLLALVQVPAPAVVAHEHERVPGPHQTGAVPAEFALVVAPDPLRQLTAGLQLGLEVQVQVADRVEAHGRIPPSHGYAGAYAKGAPPQRTALK